MEDTSKLKFRCHCGKQITVQPTLVERRQFVGPLEQAGWRWIPEHGWVCPVHVEEVTNASSR